MKTKFLVEMTVAHEGDQPSLRTLAAVLTASTAAEALAEGLRVDHVERVRSRWCAGLAGFCSG